MSYCGGGAPDPGSSHQPHEIPGSLGSWCEGQPQGAASRIENLEARLARLEDRFQSMLAVNGLWDGS